MKSTENPTTDLTRFGWRELEEAGRLLTAFTGPADNNFLGSGVQLWFNTHSGNVFLCDEDYNVGMMNGDKLEQFFSCPVCGHEGFLEEMDHLQDTDDKECIEYMKDIGAIHDTKEEETTEAEE